MWVEFCRTDEIAEEDLKRFDHDGQSICVYNTPEGFFATDGLCTHEAHHLEDGLVFGTVIECPVHQGRFDVTNGKALSSPVCIDLRTYPVRVEDGRLFVQFD